MSRNNFSGSVPSQLFHLPLLQYLSLDGNSFSGKVLVEIGNLSSLQALSLSGNRFSGVLLSVSSKGLEFLDLSDNDLSTELPTEIGNLPNISTLALSNNRLTGGIPSSMQKLSKLEKLYLQNNLLTGEIPSWLFDFKGLRDLYLGGNRLIWNSSVEIAPNPRPFRLSLKSCGLVGEVPKWISTQADNEFTGSLPPGLFSGLSALALSRNNFSGENRFSGPFPVFYPKVQLAYIDFSSNDFSGEVPTTFPKETRYLALGGNKFNPESIFNLSNLRILDVSKSRNLVGMIEAQNSPSSILPTIALDFTVRWSSQEVQVSLEFRDLISLDLSHNKLSGSIPQTLTKLQQLTILDVSNNQLTGRIPDGGQMGTMVLDPNYYANNSGLCGMQIHLSCPEDEPHHRQSHRSMIIRSHGFMGRCMDWVPSWLVVSNRNHISNRVFYLTTTLKPPASLTTSNQTIELNQNIGSRAVST
ncbi:hypothetical protein AAG906_032000 [Vitis piasezkii]